MQRSSTAAVLLLLAWFGGLVTAEVVNNFHQCKNFLYKEIDPKGITGDNYQPICQRYKNKYRFATLYNRNRRAPLFSAYKIIPASGQCQRPPVEQWYYEPQLASRTKGKDMEPFPTKDQNVIDSQAVLADYTGTLYTYGHLNPSLHQATQDDCEATFTLTNVVPQREGSNSGPWAELERNIKERFQTYCENEMFVITGGMPYAVEKWMNQRVSIPEYMWSAYCCPSFKPNIPKPMKDRFPTYAAVGRNDPTSSEEIVPIDQTVEPIYKRGYDVKEMSLMELEKILKQRLNLRKLTLFYNNCT
ncbi:endonuclease domain-containing 1 protein-like [Parambassis ranga]|uniref:Endonuclease domain-containing 1 protein-like n=1 Tax=Parambassis ranga TaxID=210632 RepID=A0A6P7J7C5_9TELE|nr:endonuclease domain-containing 1 protein-like [Parambassis ranga]